jgi:hypothetical protein
VFIIHGNTTVVPPWGQHAYYEQEKNHWKVTGQFSQNTPVWGVFLR